MTDGQPTPGRKRRWRRHDEIPVIELHRTNPVRFAVIGFIVVAIVLYFGFTKALPFKHGFKLNAAFTSAQNVHSKSPVRIAGVNVGKVTHIKREGNVGVVEMEIESGGLPIHSDATAKIRPRIFLEGNWFVDLQPGSPSAPTVSSGYTLPVAQTAVPVQLDQVLNALNTETRANLQNFLIGYGEGLTRKPNAAEDLEQDPEVRGINGAQALNKAYQRGRESLRATAVLQTATAGTSPHDLSALVKSIGKVTAALNVHEQQLSEWVPHFNEFFKSFAAQSSSLREAVAVLPSALESVNRGLRELNSSFAPTREFAHDILPGVKSTNATVAASLPWIEQVRLSLSPQELGGVAKGLGAATPSLARLTSEQTPLYQQTELFNKCLTKTIIPAGNTKIQDGSATTGVENYKEFWYAITGLAGISQSFDGNGVFSRFLLGGGGPTLASGQAEAVGANLSNRAEHLRLLAHATLPPLGTRPAFQPHAPKYQPLVPCYTQAPPEFNGPLSQGPADGQG